MSGLRGKVAIITGASAGIGRGTARHLARLGTRLCLVARNRENLESTARYCLKEGSPQVHICPYDLTVEEQCEKIVEETLQKFKGINILINNAGILNRRGFQEVTLQEIENSMKVNLNTAVKMSQLVVPHLSSAGGGSIVNISSIAGIRAYRGSIAYKMSKAAMDHMTKIVALEVAESGVRVNSVNPGVIDTDIFLKSGLTQQEVEEYYSRQKKLHPLGRIGQVEDVAKAVAFLASDDAAFITGQILAVDGGRSVGIQTS